MGQQVEGSTGQTGHISTVYVGGPRNCLEGFFFEKVNRSTGRRVKWVDGSNGSTGHTGQQVTFTFTILYMIADDARLTPPRCKKHTAYDDTRLTPHHCKSTQRLLLARRVNFLVLLRGGWLTFWIHELMVQLVRSYNEAVLLVSCSRWQ